jgi:peptidase E
MKKLLLLFLIVGTVFSNSACHSQGGPRGTSESEIKRMIFVYGNGMERAFIEYVATLTGKEKPKICFFPTAAADDPRVIAYWHKLTDGLAIESCAVRTFISSAPEQKSFEEEILSSDAIIVGGGNTLNMIAVWHAQGIDTLLRMAYEKGVVMAGGSAGSLCWFTGGYSDSRPKELSIIDCLGFLPYSHCPHYDHPDRRSLYLEAVESGIMEPGYACEDGAALLFTDGQLSESFSLHPDRHSYFVTVEEGRVTETMLPAKILK